MEEMRNGSIAEDMEQSEEVKMPEVKLPSSGGVQFSNPNIEEAIKKDKITNAALEETSQLEHPAYLIDLSNIYSVLPCTMRAIKCLLLDNVDIEKLNIERADKGQALLKMDTALYFLLDGGVRLIGHGDGYQFYKQLENFIRGAFGEKTKIYKSIINQFTGEVTFGEAKTLDVDQVVLRLDV